MNEIITELSKPVWWVSVVVAGIVINLISGYLKTSLDSSILQTFSWWRKKSETRKMAWQARIERIRNNDEIRNRESISEFRLRLQSIHMLLLAIFCMSLPSLMTLQGNSSPIFLTIALLLLSAACFFASFLAFMQAGNTASALREARQKSNPTFKRTPDGAA